LQFLFSLNLVHIAMTELNLISQFPFSFLQFDDMNGPLTEFLHFMYCCITAATKFNSIAADIDAGYDDKVASFDHYW